MYSLGILIFYQLYLSETGLGNGSGFDLLAPSGREGLG